LVHQAHHGLAMVQRRSKPQPLLNKQHLLHCCLCQFEMDQVDVGP
jgi:hypothetical protein